MNMLLNVCNMTFVWKNKGISR